MQPQSYVTGGRQAAVLAIALVPLTPMALGVGTGGSPTAQYYIERGEMGYSYPTFQPSYEQGTSEQEYPGGGRTPAENLARIRDAFKPTMTELASLFGVSRQAVYDWQGGRSLAPENERKLSSLADAVDLLMSEGIEISSQLLRRKIVGGKSLFDVTRDGGSVERAAQTLVRIARRESEQRKHLGDRLAHRSRAMASNADFGSPRVDEEG